MKKVEDLRRENLEALVRAHGGTIEAVASACGTSPIYLSQIRNQTPDAKTKRPRQMGAQLARKLEAGYGKPSGWMDTQHLAAGEAPAEYAVAHDLSHLGTQTSPIVSWGVPVPSLPQQFKTSAPDDALSPRVRLGQVVELDRGLEPRPGDGVLITDTDGRWYLRIYKSGRPGVWEAHTLNEAYQPLLSDRDGLTVVAVIVAVHARWA